VAQTRDEWNSNGHRRRQLKAKFLPAGQVVKCWLCGMPGADSLDHRLPKSKYPELVWDEANIQPAHQSCNSIKGDGPGAPTLGPPSEEW
jgi:5-methylcytosine-specific restriction endonuclease McrA